MMLLFALTLGCGGQQQAIPGKVIKSAKAIAPLPTPGQFYTPGLAEFGSTTALTMSPLENRVLKTLRRTLRPPPSLDCLAREYAGRFGADGVDPPPSTVHALAQHCGYWSRPAQPYSVTAPSLDAIEAHLRTLPGDSTQGAFGLGVAPHPDGRFTVTLLIPPRDVSVDPFPRHGSGRLSGRLERGDGKIEFWVQDTPNSPARRLDAEMNPTGAFAIELPEPSGGHRVEIARVRGDFRQTIALMRRGHERTSSYAVPAEQPTKMDAVSFSEAINAYRASRNQPTLRLEQHLSGPLNDWLQRAAKQSRSTIPPGILDPRGWRYARMDYAFTYGRTPSEAVALLADTPTGFALLNSPDHDRAAIGLLPFERDTGFDAVLVSLARFEFKEPEAVRRPLLERMNSARQRAGLAPLRLAPALQALTQRTVEAVMAGRLPWEKALKALKATVIRDKLAGGIFGSGGDTVIRVDELKVEHDPVVMTPAVRWIGIGIVGGPLPGGGEPRYIVIYVGAEKTGKVR